MIQVTLAGFPLPVRMGKKAYLCLYLKWDFLISPNLNIKNAKVNPKMKMVGTIAFFATFLFKKTVQLMKTLNIEGY